MTDKIRRDDRIAAAAETLALPIPDACRAGVVANIVLLDGYADLLAGFVPPAHPAAKADRA